ncbi:MAG: HDOD domain-containing protein [Lentisphaerota bacterium]
MDIGSYNVQLDSVISSLNGEKFSTIPSVLAELLRLARDPMTEANDLASLCEKDISSSSRILKAANSVYFGRRLDQPKVTTLQDAIVRVGFRIAQEIILSSTLSAIMLAHDSILDYSAIGLWKHSIAVGISNRIIYKKVFGVTQSIDPYLVGLLHDMGIAIEHQMLFYKGFADAIQQRYSKGSDLYTEENLVIGFSHESIGAAAAQAWNFPDYLVEVIGHHHSYDPVKNQHHHLLHINRVSEWICYFMSVGYSDFSKAHAELLSDSQKVLGLTREHIQQISSELKAEMECFENLGWFSTAHQSVA